MRITEEQERREREARIQQRLPLALAELGRELSDCLDAYRSAFGEQSAELSTAADRLTVIVREQRDAAWNDLSRVEVTQDLALPGFRVLGTPEPFSVEVGVLPGEKLFYRRGDQYLNLEDVTRMILDRALFPRLID
jgi:hypothetical protein